MTDSKVLQLIKKENEHRRLAQAHENKAEYHWNKSNELLLEIMSVDKKELDCSNSSSSMGV